jgi:hypothetical protein
MHLAALLALFGMLVAGAHVPAAAPGHSERARLAALGMICLGGGTGDQVPATPAGHDEACCILCLSAGAPAPLPQAGPALPPPADGPVVRAAAPPPARAPPPAPARPFQPRGPPVPV